MDSGPIEAPVQTDNKNEKYKYPQNRNENSFENTLLPVSAPFPLLLYTKLSLCLIVKRDAFPKKLSMYSAAILNG